MGTEGRRGDGPRHRFYPPTKAEARDRELTQAKREVERLTHKLEAIQGTLRVVGKLAAPFANERKPSMPLRRIIEITGKK